MGLQWARPVNREPNIYAVVSNIALRLTWPEEWPWKTRVRAPAVRRRRWETKPVDEIHLIVIIRLQFPVHRSYRNSGASNDFMNNDPWVTWRTDRCFASTKVAAWIRKNVRAKMVVFQCPRVCLTISDPDWLSRCETGFNPGIRSWKKHLPDWARRQKVLPISRRSEELRLYNLV
jgi:hypothetical protein